MRKIMIKNRVTFGLLLALASVAALYGVTFADPPANPTPSTPPVQSAPSSLPPMRLLTFEQPKAFECEKTINWKDLETWGGIQDLSICGEGLAYKVEGKVYDKTAYKVRGEIWVPEANRGWPWSGGEYKPVDPADGRFNGFFCIPQKGPKREFRFEVYNKERALLGKCKVVVEELW